MGQIGHVGQVGQVGRLGQVGLLGQLVYQKKLLPLVPNSHPDAVIIERDLGLHKVPFKNFLAVKQLIYLYYYRNR